MNSISLIVIMLFKVFVSYELYVVKFVLSEDLVYFLRFFL